ncbi:MAG: toprim domain-containing protein [Ruminococcus sp.]|nr:toprim domain-containing protein [Ruminococcus sp.]
MPYIPFTDEQKVLANSVDLEHFLRMRGERLERAGISSKLIYTDGSGKHDSIMIHGSQWYDHKNQTGGGAIKFMQEYYGMSFAEAVQELLGVTVSPVSHKSITGMPKEEKKEFKLPEKAPNMRRVFAYLIKQRFIRSDVLVHFAKAGKLFEDAKYHNAVFVGLDENGVPRQASKRSTTTMGKTVKLTVEGSDTKYSFAHYGTSGRLYVFEAPIDMLSYISLHPDNWQEYSYIAMNGVYESAVLYAMETHSNIDHIVLCTDNDEGGIDGAERIRDILNERGFTNITRLYPTNKDWNEDLKARNGQPAIIAEPHKRKALYYGYVQQLRYYPCRPDRLSEQIKNAFKYGQTKYLAEYALAGSAFFMRVKDEPQGFQALQRKLAKTYRAYSDKGRMIAKTRALSDKYNEVMRDLRQSARTEEQSIATAKKLYELADSAIRVAVEEGYQQQDEQQTEDESEDEDITLSPQSGFS